MKVKRFSKATRYDAPNHRGFMGLRLQAFELTARRTSGSGSHISPRRRLLPSGGARPDPSPFEKVYVCLVGSVTVIINGVEFVLSPMDILHSCAQRSARDRQSPEQCRDDVGVMPYPDAAT